MWKKKLDEHTKKAANLEVETMLDGLTLDVDSDDAVCPKCGLAYWGMQWQVL